METPFNEKKFKIGLAIINVLTRILGVASVIIIVLSVFGFISGLVYPNDITTDLSTLERLRVSIGQFSFTVDNLEGIIPMKSVVIYGSIAGFSYGIFMYLIAQCLVSLVNEVQQERPFSTKSIRNQLSTRTSSPSIKLVLI